MRIGTLSLNINNDDLNYGAMLHSWAFCRFIHKTRPQDSAEIINYVPQKFTDFNKKLPVISYLKIGRYQTAAARMLCHYSYNKRLKNFYEFQKEHMAVSKVKYTYNALKEADLPYDCLVCESDVVWSADFFKGRFDPAFFLALKNMRDKKKIIYAASMANAEFSEDDKKLFRRLVKSPDFISCRESYAAKLVNEETDRSAVHTVDPVLLLEPQDYDPICSGRSVKEPYLLLYIPLGYDKRYAEAAKRYARRHNLKVVELSMYAWHGISHKVMADAGIEDFLSLIRYADAVFTNSFHAVCFCALFHVDFYAFDRRTGRKTEDFCELLELHDRYMKVEDFHECQAIDFEKTDAILNKHKQRSVQWLYKALDSRGGK